jgi:hypothetical protein
VQQDYGGIVGRHAANFDTGLFSAEQFPQPQIVGLPMRVFFGKSLPPSTQALTAGEMSFVANTAT